MSEHCMKYLVLWLPFDLLYSFPFHYKAPRDIGRYNTQEQHLCPTEIDIPFILFSPILLILSSVAHT
jgi:hypothetical protein